jgi:hypothetical protein
MDDHRLPLEGVAHIRVDPALAQLWLDELDNLCRPLDQTVVDRMAADMTMGFWRPNRLTPNTIKVDQYFALVDGARRLNAIVQSGETVEIAVERVTRLDP